MKILCLAKFVPDVEQIGYDYERNVLIRKGVPTILNPEDATALANALALKARVPETVVETISLSPRSVMPHVEDCIRRGVDRATLLTDPVFVGSDTWATSLILFAAIRNMEFDSIFTGTHTLDGGTAHVPAQVAELLDLAHLSQVVDLDLDSLYHGPARVDVDDEEAIFTFEVDPPAVLGFAYAPDPRLPYISRENAERDVSDQINVLTNAQLQLDPASVGSAGSKTRVSGVEIETLEKKMPVIVGTDPDGIETVYQFLKKAGMQAR